MPTLISIIASFLFLGQTVRDHGTYAFSMTFPTSTWVACKPNVLQWSYDEKDPDIFSVALFNSNRTRVNGNYQIANSLPARNGTAIVRPNCQDPGAGYYLSFVNASKYAENEPQVYYTSPTFSIVAASETVPTPNGTKLTNNGTLLVNSDGSIVNAGETSSSAGSTDVGSSSSSTNAYRAAVAATPLPSTTDSKVSPTANTGKNDGKMQIGRPFTLFSVLIVLFSHLHLL